MLILDGPRTLEMNIIKTTTTSYIVESSNRNWDVWYMLTTKKDGKKNHQIYKVWSYLKTQHEALKGDVVTN